MNVTQADRPPKLHANLIRHTAAVLAEIEKGAAPADRLLHQYFRNNKQLGRRDREFIAETVYGVLRHRPLLQHVLPSLSTTPTTACLAYLIRYAGISARALQDIGFTQTDGMATRELVETIRQLDSEALPLSARYNLPDWLLERLARQLNPAEISALAQALNQPAKLDLRVNSLKATRELAAQSLRDEGYPVDTTPYSNDGLRHTRRSMLNQTTAFKNGWIEVQDEGSQLLSRLVDPQPGEQIVDFCAGAGGKTLHLAALMQNRGSLYAFDISPKRLQQCKPRLKRAGLDNVRLHVIRNENDGHIKRLRGKIDRVLVDAPCSGTGTLRRNPDIKLRDIDLPQLTATQSAILSAAAKLLKPDGRLVYATCSLLMEENEHVVTAFLQTHPEFQRRSVNDILQPLDIPLKMPNDFLRLWPHQHHTDGFFAAVLTRTLPATSN